MGKSKKATRKELETVIQDIIKELGYLRQGFTAIDNYLGAYVKFKGDSIMFNDYLKTEIERMQQDIKETPKQPTTKDIQSAKKERYAKIKTPPL